MTAQDATSSGTLTIRPFFRTHEDAWRRVVSYGCDTCEWAITLRDYRSRPKRATRSGVAALNRHMAETGHTAGWFAAGRA